MNYFVEGLQGSGKSTLVQKVLETHPGHVAVREGDYSPVELAWCAYVSREKYGEILDKYAAIRDDIEKKTTEEGDKRIICYTQIMTDIPGFHKDLEQYEIYNGRVSPEDFKDIVLIRYRNLDSDRNIFECSIFQNTVEDMILFRCMTDEEIIAFYRDVRKALEGKEYRILYLEAEDLRVIRRERSDDQGNELWFPLMIGYFNDSPYARGRGLRGEEELLKHFEHRQRLELKIIREVFADKSTVFKSKGYTEEEVAKL